MDMVFHASLAVFLPLAGLVLWTGIRLAWVCVGSGRSHSRMQMFRRMVPGLALLGLVLAPVLYTADLRRADDRCLAMFAAPQPDAAGELSTRDLKERRINAMQALCPGTDYHDLLTRMKQRAD